MISRNYKRAARMAMTVLDKQLPTPPSGELAIKNITEIAKMRKWLRLVGRKQVGKVEMQAIERAWMLIDSLQRELSTIAQHRNNPQLLTRYLQTVKEVAMVGQELEPMYHTGKLVIFKIPPLALREGDMAIVISDIELRIRLELTNTPGLTVGIVNPAHKPSERYRGVNERFEHNTPHLHVSHNTEICWGTHRGNAQAMLANNKIAAAVDTLLRALVQQGDDRPYIQLKRWCGFECSVCKVRVSAAHFCTVCNATLCPTHLRQCSDCSRIVCAICEPGWAFVSNTNYCDRCTTKCEECGTKIRKANRGKYCKDCGVYCDRCGGLASYAKAIDYKNMGILCPTCLPIASVIIDKIIATAGDPPTPAPEAAFGSAKTVEELPDPVEQRIMAFDRSSGTSS